MSQQVLEKNLKNKEVRVIIVEDYKLTRVGLRFALNEIENINVIAEAQNAEIGLELIKKEQPDVVLMDLGLPGINGLEATAQIKNISPNTKIILQSCFPVAKNMDMNNYSIDYMQLNGYIDKLNLWTSELARENGFGYLNTSEILKNEKGALRDELQSGEHRHYNSAWL